MQKNEKLDCTIYNGELNFTATVWYETGTRTYYECWGFPCYEDDYDDRSWDFSIRFTDLTERFEIDEDIWCWDNGEPDDVQINDILNQMMERYPKWADAVLEYIDDMAQEDFDYYGRYDYDPYDDYDI